MKQLWRSYHAIENAFNTGPSKLVHAWPSRVQPFERGQCIYAHTCTWSGHASLPLGEKSIRPKKETPFSVARPLYQVLLLFRRRSCSFLQTEGLRNTRHPHSDHFSAVQDDPRKVDHAIIRIVRGQTGNLVPSNGIPRPSPHAGCGLPLRVQPPVPQVHSRSDKHVTKWILDILVSPSKYSKL